MKKILKNQAGFSTVAIIVAVVVVIAAIGIVFILHPGKEEPIKIGAVLSLSGPGQYSGVEVRDGMLLAVDEVNSRGGINGKKIALVIEDHKTNPEEGKEAFDKIERTHHPVLYLSTQSSVAMALVPLAEKHQVVLVCLLATAPKITEHKEWVFRYWPTAEAVLEELKNRNATDIHILTGGLISPGDAKVLNEMGVLGNYGPGTPLDLIVKHVKKLVKKADV